ncbi:MAG: NAD(P)/FAD-dependent oxidoreductase [Anaerolineae bacterium]|nr:NAD(P)/FAD-dependent oxidoreductase [Anaerolineae bacterium]
MKLRDEYDLLVIGGGPGGATAALIGARQGLDVLLVEKRQEIGTPVRCAEALSHTWLEPYIPVDERWICAEIDAFRVVGPSGNSVRVPPTDPTVIVERKIFDRELVNEAIRAGATVRAMTRVTGVTMEDGSVRGARLVSLGQEIEVRAKITIAADGPESQIGRWVGIKTTPRAKEYYTAVQYLLAGIELADPRECQYHLGNSLAPGGYAWVFPKGPDKANVGLVVTSTYEKHGRSAQAYLDAFVERVYPGASVLGLVIGGIPVGGTLKQIVGDGIMLVGDAAHQAEPITGGGINLAMVAGDLAATVAAEAIAAGDWSKRGLEPYGKQWHKLHGRASASMSSARHAALSFSDERYEKLIGLAAELDLDGMSVADIVLRVLRHDPGLLLHAKAFLFN